MQTSFIPYVGEPYIVQAQVLCQQQSWREAKELAAEGLKWLTLWGTNWDKRVTFEGWVCWARCLFFQACREEWPDSSGGVESLGAVQAGQRFREINVGSNFLRFD